MAVIGVPLLLAIPSALLLMTRHAGSASDWALMELRTRDVMSSHPPLLGAYSRYGWAHPGPLAYYVLVIPYQLFGADAKALLWAALLINTIVIGLTVWIAGRQGTASALSASLLVVMVVRTATLPMVMHDPWNASLVVLPFLLLLVCCWCALCGDDLAGLIGAFTYLFVVQTHVGFAVVATPLVAMSAVRVWRRRHANGQPTSVPARATLMSVAIVSTLPVVIDALANWPGNIGHVLRWSLTTDEPPRAGAGFALDVVLRASSVSYVEHLRLPVFVNVLTSPMSGGLLPGAGLLLLAIAGAWAFRLRHAGARAAVTMLGILWVSAAVATASLRGPRFEWLFGWLAPIVWATWSTVLAVAWLAIRARAPRLDQALVVAGAVIAVMVGISQVDRVRNEPFEWQQVGAAAAELATAAHNEAGDRPVRIDYDRSTPDAEHLLAGVINLLDRDGVNVQVPDDWALRAGGHRTRSVPGAIVLEVAQEAITVHPDDRRRQLAVYDEADAPTRTEVDRLTAELTDLLVDAGRDDLVPSLATTGATILLAATDDPTIAAHRVDIERLEQLRKSGATRYVLYEALPD
jgi:hypothetical protein